MWEQNSISDALLYICYFVMIDFNIEIRQNFINFLLRLIQLHSEEFQFRVTTSFISLLNILLTLLLCLNVLGYVNCLVICKRFSLAGTLLACFIKSILGLNIHCINVNKNEGTWYENDSPLGCWSGLSTSFLKFKVWPVNIFDQIILKKKWNCLMSCYSKF